MKPYKDLTGKKINRLKIIEPSYKKNGHYVWKCECDCGKTTYVVGSKIVNETTKSCGCWDSEVAANHIRSLMKNKGGFKGKNNPRWRFDWTDEERELNKNIRFITDPKKNRWRKKVYDRDNYTCQKCKQSKSGTLTAHHIYSWKSHPHLRYITKNGITFCLNCHIKFHQKYGYKNNNKKQLTEYLRVL